MENRTITVINHICLFAVFFSILTVSSAIADVFEVTQFNDPPPDGCNSTGCSSREAILASKSTPDEDKIVLPEGIFMLGIAGRGEDSGVTGDLDILDDLVIQGAGVSKTIIDANNLDRIFDIHTGASLTISDVTITGGLPGLFRGHGGGIRVAQGASIELINVVIRGNRARSGSAIWSGGSATLSHSVIDSNTRSFALFRSTGAIHIDTGTASIRDSVIRDNRGLRGGGIYTQGNVQISTSTFLNNSGRYGGAIYVGAGSLRVSNSTFTQNSVLINGGALFNSTVAQTELVNVTVSDNSADNEGGGLYGVKGGTLLLANTLVANNVEGGDCGGLGIGSLGQNLFSDNSCASDKLSGEIVGEDPLLDKLDHYGGSTQTIALLPGSPAINAGDNAHCEGAEVGGVDQRGILRDNCDIGAFEWHPVSTANAALGTNLGAIRPESTELPFGDIFKQSRFWTPVCLFGQPDCIDVGSNTGESIPADDLDENGWVKALPAPDDPPVYTTLRAYLFTSHTASDFRAGQYIVTFEGSGNIRYGGAASLIQDSPSRHVIEIAASGDAYLDVTETDIDQTGDYLRNIQVVRSDLESGTATLQFTPEFLDKARQFSVLRYMDWMRTNDEPPGVWSVRPSEYDSTFSLHGVPLEVLLQLSNQLQVAPWFNMPHSASDNYMSEFATMVRERLNSDLPVYIEYSNETWNTSTDFQTQEPAFPQSDWVQDMAEVLYQAPRNVISGASYHGQRTVEMCQLWRTVWADQADRIICVNAGQANPLGGGTAQRVLACELWGQGPCDSSNGINAIAVAPYFGNYIGHGNASNIGIVNDWIGEPDGGLNALFEEIFNGNGLLPNGGALARARDWIQQNKVVANTHGVELISYEGGQHLQSNPFTTLLTDANRDLRMGDVYDEYLNDWKQLGGCLFMNYTLAWTGYNPRGSWGVLEFINEDSTPKFDAIQNFISNNPLPWNGCSPAATPP